MRHKPADENAINVLAGAGRTDAAAGAGRTDACGAHAREAADMAAKARIKNREWREDRHGGSVGAAWAASKFSHSHVIGSSPVTSCALIPIMTVMTERETFLHDKKKVIVPTRRLLRPEKRLLPRWRRYGRFSVLLVSSPSSSSCRYSLAFSSGKTTRARTPTTRVRTTTTRAHAPLLRAHPTPA